MARTMVNHQPNSQSTPTPAFNGAIKDSVEIFKGFRINADSTCCEVLPAILKKYNIISSCNQYSLCILHGDQVRHVALHEKPIELFKKLGKEGRHPVFMLRKKRARAVTPHSKAAPFPQSSSPQDKAMETSRFHFEISAMNFLHELEKNSQRHNSSCASPTPTGRHLGTKTCITSRSPSSRSSRNVQKSGKASKRGENEVLEKNQESSTFHAEIKAGLAELEETIAHIKRVQAEIEDKLAKIREEHARVEKGKALINVGRVIIKERRSSPPLLASKKTSPPSSNVPVVPLSMAHHRLKKSIGEPKPGWKTRLRLSKHVMVPSPLRYTNTTDTEDPKDLGTFPFSMEDTEVLVFPREKHEVMSWESFNEQFGAIWRRMVLIGAEVVGDDGEAEERKKLMSLVIEHYDDLSADTMETLCTNRNKMTASCFDKYSVQRWKVYSEIVRKRTGESE